MVVFQESRCHGKGIFATEDIPENVFIHVTHVWSSKNHMWMNINWNCLYNHSKTKENCEVKDQNDFTNEVDLPKGWKVKYLKTIRNVNKGEELFVDYTKQSELEQPEEQWNP